MTNHPNRSAVAAARRRAKAAGYYVREGSYRNTTDDRLGRWYFGLPGAALRPWGAGYRNQSEAWLAAAEHLDLVEVV